MDENNVAGDAARAVPTEAPASTPEVPADKLQQVGQAMVTAAAAVRQGADDARANALELAPAVGESVSRAVYATCYYLSYGVVFPAVFVASLLPLNNAVGFGLVDGASAAKEAVSAMRSRRKARREAEQQHLPTTLSVSSP